MKVFTTIADYESWRYAQAEQSLAFVPTMGNLHDGHLALVNHAGKIAEQSIVSIYVNPTQFGEGEDFDTYPRTLDDDLVKLERAGVTAAFVPSDIEMYPDGFPVPTKIMLPEMANILCGASRPGHFDGVGLVVSKLFNIIRPTSAIFGQKDFQQLAIIQQLCRDLSYPIKIIGVATQRASDGLALSSRNQYLSDHERTIAPKLLATLKCIRDNIMSGEDASVALDNAKNSLTEAGFSVDYLEVRDAASLGKFDKDADSVILVAAWLGKTRLIDNLVFRLL